jgi:uncharacterized protein YkwD
MHGALKGYCRNAKRSIPALASAIALLSAACAEAGPVRYTGKVVDGSGIAIAWAILQLEGTTLVTQSGADGSFTLSGNAAAAIEYPDPQPVPPAFVLAASSDAPVRYLLTGRAATSRHLAATPTLSLPAGRNASASRSGSDAASLRNAWEPDPPAPPRSVSGSPLPKPAGGFRLTVRMAHFATAAFPQSADSAKNLTLTLTPSPTDTAMYAAEKEACLDTLNALRATLGLKPVAWSKSLEAFADQGARYDSERNAAHQHFKDFSTRAVPSDAENAIPGWPMKSYKTVSAVVAQGAKMMWDEGPGGGHYENIKGDHTQVGCGVYVTPAGSVWVIHDFK